MPESTAVSDASTHGAAAFATTRWTRVLLARDANSTEARDALAELCGSYWYPLYAFVRRSGHGPHDSQDLVQEFFARLLSRDWLAQVDRAKGRFRSFLLAAMKHFLANEWDKSQALKRGGDQQFISLDQNAAEARYGLEPAHSDSPDKIFERRWAMMLLEKVLARLREEHARQGKERTFEELKNSLAGSRESLPYAEIGARLGVSEGAVKVTVHRFRQRYRELLREEVARTVATPEEVDEELRELFEVLRS